ncbi:hypothetical protein F2Q69_00009245 [Brassica cretica]|uniref:Uncharacterized protein n=1 Tax=Brassica cretica TaxID=69181 RepID=A0A8S9NSZ1_BRACR|nr:hypothetical protein F2Q69_00009245 [Brassica cretica]
MAPVMSWKPSEFTKMAVTDAESPHLGEITCVLRYMHTGCKGGVGTSRFLKSSVESGCGLKNFKVYAKGGKTIVFTQTKRDADEVSLALSNSIASEALHGDISQYQRERKHSLMMLRMRRSRKNQLQMIDRYMWNKNKLQAIVGTIWRWSDRLYQTTSTLRPARMTKAEKYYFFNGSIHELFKKS